MEEFGTVLIEVHQDRGDVHDRMLTMLKFHHFDIDIKILCRQRHSIIILCRQRHNTMPSAA